MGRIVITGLGIVSAIGIGKEEFWENALKGKCGTAQVTSFDTSDFDNHNGGEIKDFDPGSFLSDENVSKHDRASILAIIGSKLAVEDAGLELPGKSPERVGVSMGTTMGGIQALERIDRMRLAENQTIIPASLFWQYSSSTIPANVANFLGVSGPNIILPNACAAGNFAIGHAYDMLRANRADFMIAGGTDCFSWIPFTGFNRVGAMSDDVVRPFDANSKGMMLGEGAAMLVLEPLETALKRKTTIYAEIMGYGISSDAHHITAPHPDSRGLVAAINAALKNSSLESNQIDSVIAHGTGTPSNDYAELQALTIVFGERHQDLPITSIKSMIGHSLGASSAIEALTNALVVSRNQIPPTINYKTPHPDFNLRIVANNYMEKNVQYGMNNALAFGGNNSSLILGKYPGE